MPVISVEPAKEHSAEPESRLSEEERKVLAEIRIAKYKALEKIKVHRSRAFGAGLSNCS